MEKRLPILRDSHFDSGNDGLAALPELAGKTKCR
jgi:hypothetical protein